MRGKGPEAGRWLYGSSRGDTVGSIDRYSHRLRHSCCRAIPRLPDVQTSTAASRIRTHNLNIGCVVGSGVERACIQRGVYKFVYWLPKIGICITVGPGGASKRQLGPLVAAWSMHKGNVNARGTRLSFWGSPRGLPARRVGDRMGCKDGVLVC